MYRYITGFHGDFPDTYCIAEITISFVSGFTVDLFCIRAKPYSPPLTCSACRKMQVEIKVTELNLELSSPLCKRKQFTYSSTKV